LGDIGKKTGLDQSVISFIERYKMPNFDVACKISEVLDITPTELWANIRDEYGAKEMIERPPKKRKEGTG